MTSSRLSPLEAQAQRNDPYPQTEASIERSRIAQLTERILVEQETGWRFQGDRLRPPVHPWGYGPMMADFIATHVYGRQR